MSKQLLQTAILILFIMVSVSTSAQKKLKYNATYFDKFPTYSEVIEAYYTENQYAQKESQKTKFGKKYDGWYVIFLDNEYEEIKSRLLWSAKSAAFKNLKTKGEKSGSSDDVLQAKKQFERGLKPVFFEQYPVYGYNDYESDVIRLLAKEKNLSASLLDALARSYSSKGMQTLMPGQFGGEKKFFKYDETFNPKDWDEAVLNQFMELMDQSIATFKKLVEKHPDYQTIVGNIKTKYHNEYMSAYYALMYSGQSELAEKYLIDNLYDDFQIKTAVNRLKTCATNGILFTVGDNDTYQLIYAQDKLGVRPDVRVVNTSLANLGRYINFITTTYGISTTLPVEEYQLDNNNYILIRNETEVMDLRDYFRILKGKENIYVDEKNDVRYFPATIGALMIPNKTLSKQIGVSRLLEEKEAKFEFGNRYLSKSNIFILDIISTDYWRTPIYFSVGSQFVLRELGIEDYTQIEGLAYRLLPKGTHDFTLLETNVLYSFEYVDFKNVDWYSSENHIALMHYQMPFMEALKFRKNNPQKVEKILNKMETVFPHSTIGYKSYAAQFADFCYGLELNERGDKLVKNEIQHIHAYFKRMNNKTTLTRYDKQMIKSMLYAANRLVTITEMNERTEFENLGTRFQEYLIKYGE